MKVSLNWLKEYVNIDMAVSSLCDALTMAGLEVEGLEQVGGGLDKVVAARIIHVEPHPDADRLSLCLVDTGPERFQVVCGAQNMKEGDLAPMALPGAHLPTGRIVEANEIRGKLSNGMLLAEDEMGLSDDHSGIMILPADAPPGEAIGSVLSLPDWILEIGITPNRVDCACVIGIAREIAAITGERLRIPEITIKQDGPDIASLSSVTIEDPTGCPRYAAGLIQGIQLRSSPFWMRYRLFHSGVRSISNIVDVTNYVMMEMGQPLHAFDYNRLKENRIVVKRAAEGDKFTTLDGQSRNLSADTLMICDSDRLVAIAGIMGGLNSEIYAGTRNVLVESAFFDPVTIRRGARKLGLSTEASFRFERGLDIQGVPRALKRSLSLMLQLAGGVCAAGLLDNYPRPFSPRQIPFRVSRANAFLGTNLSSEAMATYLESLDMKVDKTDREMLQVTPNSFRMDLQREVDLIEEVARLYGYNKIPVSYPLINVSEEDAQPELPFDDRVRSLFTSFGFTEVISYSFISPEAIAAVREKGDDDHSAVKIMNPLSSDQSVLRTSLIPGLLAALRTNLAHGEKELKLFECGKIFLGRAEALQPHEKTCLAAVLAGPYRSKTWYCNERETDYYDAKGAFEGLLANLGITDSHFRKGVQVPAYNPEISCEVIVRGTRIGYVGEISKEVMKAFDLENEIAYLLDVDIEALLGVTPREIIFNPFSNFPSVYRDISIIVKLDFESDRIIDLIKEEAEGLVESIRVFDCYAGEELDRSEKAVGFRVCYRSDTGTLDGVEVNRLHEAIIERIRRETGGRLREG